MSRGYKKKADCTPEEWAAYLAEASAKRQRKRESDPEGYKAIKKGQKDRAKVKCREEHGVSLHTMRKRSSKRNNPEAFRNRRREQERRREQRVREAKLTAKKAVADAMSAEELALPNPKLWAGEEMRKYRDLLASRMSDEDRTVFDAAYIYHREYHPNPRVLLTEDEKRERRRQNKKNQKVKNPEAHKARARRARKARMERDPEGVRAKHRARKSLKGFRLRGERLRIEALMGKDWHA